MDPNNIDTTNQNKSHGNKKTWVLIILIILVLALASAAYLYMIMQKVNENQINQDDQAYSLTEEEKVNIIKSSTATGEGQVTIDEYNRTYKNTLSATGTENISEDERRAIIESTSSNR